MKLSVIVPVYNTKKYLRRCLESLINQTLADMEILLVNDGSTDGSDVILREYEEKYPQRIRVIDKENGGQATARNLGIRESKGQYIGFVDSDDYVETDMFCTMVELALEDDLDMVECNYSYLEEKEDGLKPLATRGDIRQYKDQKDMFINPMTAPWNKVIKREILMQDGNQFPEGFIYEDTAFCIKLIPHIKKMKYVDKPFVNYILRGTSTMNANKSRKVADIFCVIEDILSFYREKGFYEEYSAELEFFCTKILLCSSLSRIGRIPDKKLESELYDKTFAFIEKNFPRYKLNPYISGKVGMYMRMVSRRNCTFFGRLLGKVMKG